MLLKGMSIQVFTLTNPKKLARAGVKSFELAYQATEILEIFDAFPGKRAFDKRQKVPTLRPLWSRDQGTRACSSVG